MHQPDPAWLPANVTLALYGTSVVSFCSITAFAFAGSIVGGSLIDSLIEVFGLTTFPALDTDGSPSHPVMERLGSQVF